MKAAAIAHFVLRKLAKEVAELMKRLIKGSGPIQNPLVGIHNLLNARLYGSFGNKLREINWNSSFFLKINTFYKYIIQTSFMNFLIYFIVWHGILTNNNLFLIYLVFTK